MSRRNGVDHYCKSCTNDRRRFERYGIEPDVYLKLLQDQGGVCAICLNPPEGDSVLHVDHCHNTLVVRGLLCSPCNTAIGLLRESVSVIGRAAEYVRLAQV